MESLKRDYLKGSRTRTKALNAILNKATRKKSIRGVAFSDSKWGNKTQKYMDSIKAIPDHAYGKVIVAAKPFVSPKYSLHYTGSDEDDVLKPGDGDKKDGRACLIYISDD